MWRGIEGFTCVCAPGFEGAVCDVNIDDCVDEACQHGGTCVDGVEAFACTCVEPFYGELCECGPTGAATVDYSDDGTFQTAAIDTVPPGVHVTSSGTINVLNLNGVGVLGGFSDTTIDGGESISFAFDQPSASTTYVVAAAVNLDGDGLVGEASIEAFDAADASLGVASVSETGDISLDALFVGPIKRFTITPDVDGFRLRSITVDPLGCP